MNAISCGGKNISTTVHWYFKINCEQCVNEPFKRILS
uniref:Uncharacterized protein n=1 Tax=Rhizophora mucronata TaxID=61149 RepID=A0A2P2QF15_RHIMU